jgi:hypothetical protein
MAETDFPQLRPARQVEMADAEAMAESMVMAATAVPVETELRVPMAQPEMPPHS